MPVKGKNMADVKENGMSGGVPVRLRGLKADGSSISPTMDEVTSVLPVATPNLKGLMRSDQALLSDTSQFSFGISGGNKTMYFRLGRFSIGHYSPIRLCASYGAWDSISRTAIDVTITNGGGTVIISGKGYSLVGYVLNPGHIDIYFACGSGSSLVGSIYGNLLGGRSNAGDRPEGVVFIP